MQTSEVGVVVTLRAPRGQQQTFAIEWRRSGSVPLARLRETLRQLSASTSMPVLYLSDYIGPSLRDALASDGVSFADATGWVRLSTDDPPILVAAHGADRSPRSHQPSAVHRLNGIAANRTVRALVLAGTPLGVRELALAADVSPGSVSKLLTTLTSEGVVERDERGRILTVRRSALIRRWVRDYSFAKVNHDVRYFIAPRGLDRTVSRLSGTGMPVVLTASAAARRLMPTELISVVPLRLLALYSMDPDDLGSALGLVATDPSTANVVVARPQDSRILDASEAFSPIAPVPLVLADLLTLPGRSEAEADQLMTALARTDPLWRREV